LGYYSRFNGGLVSLACYFILYWGFVSNIEKKDVQTMLKTILASTLISSLYGILEHFGIDKNVWIQDVQNRVFSSFGQPNWMAAWLAAVITISLSMGFIAKAQNRKVSIIYLLLSVIIFITLLFTKSRSGLLGLLTALLSFWSLIIITQLKNKSVIKQFAVSSFIFLFLALIIGTPWTPNISEVIKKSTSSPINTQNTLTGTALEVGGTSSIEIRKIVWQGAIDVWKNYPLFGSGVETFAFSYYQFRPASHNLVSEWDFLYNKAHNEYINYLATTGAFGLLTYSIFIGTTLLLFIKTILKDKDNFYLNLGLLTAFISILITNIAGFSVVVISLYFFLLPVLISKDKSNFIFSSNFPKFISTTSSIVIIIAAFFLSQRIFFYYLADITYAIASEYDDQNKFESAYEQIQKSIAYRNDEPVYLDKASSITAKMALVAHSQKDSALIQKYIHETENYSNQALLISPANINFWKERAQNYYYLSSIDPKYFQNAITALSKAAILAPTDAKSFYLLGKFLQTANLSDEAIPFYEKAIQLKSNYDYAYFELAKIYFDTKNYSEAKKYFQMVLKYAPDSQESKDYLDKIK
jgi:O-antigen ligase